MALTWPQIQANIFAGESGGDYNALFGYQNRPNGRFSDVNLTSMPIGDVLSFTDPSGAYGQYVKGQVGRVATPVGAYQVVGSTLRDAVNALGIDPSQPFDQATQDRIGRWIYETQGTGAWEGYRPNSTVSTRGTPTMDGYTDPQMMQPASTDPFEGLSRPQRTMLGFAALQDAAAQLQGQQGGAFQNALTGFADQKRAAQDLQFRRGQEQRLVDQQRQTRELTLLQERRRIEAARADAAQWGQPTDAFDAQLEIIDRSLSASGSPFAPAPAAATPTAATPAAATPEGGAAPAAPTAAPNLADAVTIAGSADATLDQLNSAIQLLQTSADPRAQNALKYAIERRDAMAEAAKAASEEEAVTTQQESMMAPRVDAAIGYLVSTDPDTGEESVNEQGILANIAREKAGLPTTFAYNEYKNALETIRAIRGFDSIAAAKEAGWTGTMTDRDIQIIMSSAGSLDPNDPRGTLRTLREIQSQLSPQGSGAVSGDSQSTVPSGVLTFNRETGELE